MFRLLSRVVVVSVFALSLNVALTPAAHAKPNDMGRVESGTSRSWMDAAVDWLNTVLGRQPAIEAAQASTKKRVTVDGGATTNGGPCIDPLGNPRPCP